MYEVKEDFTTEDFAAFVELLEAEDTSDALKELAEHIINFYVSQPAEERSAATADELLRIHARDDLTAFAKYVFGYTPAAHHKEIIRLLEDPERLRVLIVAPPNSAKSTYTSLIMPTFVMAKYPDLCTIMLGEAFMQVDKWGQQIRELFEGKTDWGKRLLNVFPEAEPNLKSWTKEQMRLKNRTRAVAYPNLFLAGMGSTSIQGSRADMIIMDDITGPEKARSATELNKQREDLSNMVMRRLNPDGRVLVICTRWGTEDMVPTFMKEFNFEVLHMPALADDDPNGGYVDWIPTRAYLRPPRPEFREEEPQWVPHPDGDDYVEAQLQRELQRAEEDGVRAEIVVSNANMGKRAVRRYLHNDRARVLWPERFSYDFLIQDRSVNPVSFRLVQQGDPTGIAGDQFKREWFRYYGRDQTISRLPSELRKFITVDPSVGNAKKKGKGDPFVAAVVGVDRWHNKYVLDVYRDWILPPYQRDEVERLYREHPEVQAILVESVNYQKALFYELANMGLPCLPVDSKKNKEVRMEASAIFYKQGKVFLPVDAVWLNTFVDEFTQYPRGAHDDQIDAMASLLEWLSFNFTWEMEEELEVGFG